MRSNVISSQGVHDRYGGVVPEVAARHHLALVNDVVDDALHTADVTLDDVELVAVTQGPGWSAPCWSGWPRPRAWPRRAACRWPRWTTSRATWPRTSSATSFEPPFLCLIASGRPHVPGARRGPRGLHGPRAHPRRRGRRGLRQGRAHARACPTPAAPRSSAWPPRATPARTTSRSPPACRGSTSRSPGSRRRCSTRCATWATRRRPGGPTSRPPTSTRSSRRWRVRVERGLRETGLQRLAIGGGVAANGPLRERMAGPGGRAARPRAGAVHRQRGHDRLRGALGDAAARVRRPRRLRQRGARAL